MFPEHRSIFPDSQHNDKVSLRDFLRIWKSDWARNVGNEVAFRFRNWVDLSDVSLSQLLTFDLHYKYNPKGFDISGRESPLTVVDTSALLNAMSEYVAFLGSFYYWSQPNPFQPLITYFIDPLRSISTINVNILAEIVHMYFSYLNRSVPIPGSTPEYVSAWADKYGLHNETNFATLRDLVHTASLRLLSIHHSEGPIAQRDSRQSSRSHYPAPSTSYSTSYSTSSSRSGNPKPTKVHPKRSGPSESDYGPCLGYCLYALYGKPCPYITSGRSCSYTRNGSRINLKHEPELKAAKDQKDVMSHFNDVLKHALSKDQQKRYGGP